MKIMYKGIEIGNIITNRIMTVEEAINCTGYESAEDAYNSGCPASYVDDDGDYFWDFEGMTLSY